MGAASVALPPGFELDAATPPLPPGFEHDSPQDAYAAPATPPGVIPGTIPREQVQREYAKSQDDDIKARPVLGVYAKQGAQLQDFLRKPAVQEIGKILQGLMPGMTGSLQQIAPQAAKVLGKAGQTVAQKVPKMPNFSIPGSGIIKDVMLGRAKAATEALQSKFQGVGSQAAARAAQEAQAAEAESLQTIPRATGAIQDARVAQTAYADEAAQQAAALQKEREALTGGTKSAATRGTPLQERVGTRLNEAFEARSKEAEDLYTKTLEAGRAKEAAGQPFASSPQGQEALKKLKAMRDTARGTNPLLDQERTVLDNLIGMIEGDAKKAKTSPLGLGKISGKLTKVESGEAAKPAGVEPLMKQLRLIRKYDEAASPAEGVSALPKQFAKQIEAVFEPALYGKNGWLPEGGAADAAYKLASEKLNAFGGEAGRRLTRGEKFDFRQLAASPEEFGTRFFKDSNSVKELKAMLGDDATFTSAVKDWAASKIGPMNAAQAKKWMVSNEGQLNAAGIKGDIEKHVKALADHEQKAALHEAQVASRTKELARTKAEAKAVPAKIKQGVEAAKTKATAVQQRFETLTTQLSQEHDPKKVGTLVKNMGEQLEKAGHITQEQYGEVLKAANDLEKHYGDHAKVWQTLKTIAKVIGIPAAAILGISYVPGAHAAEAPQSKRAFDDAEKERRYQEWKRRQEATQ